MLNYIRKNISNCFSMSLVFGTVICFHISGCNQQSSTSTDKSGNIQDSTSNSVASSSPTDSSSQTAAAINFKTKNFNFGIIKPDQVVEHTYVFTNTGGGPLKISDVKPGCGCTTPDWTKEEIAPGDSGKITVRFDPKGKSGKQKKSVAVYSNTVPNMTTLDFEAEIASKP